MMNNSFSLSALVGDGERDRLLVFAVAAALMYDRAPWELVLALLYIAM